MKLLEYRSYTRFFVIYINDLPLCLKNSSISMYADNAVVYFTGSDISTIKGALQEDLNCVEQWMTENQLVLNQSKTKGLLFFRN